MATCPTCEGHFDDATFCPRDGAKLVGDVGLGVVLGGRYKLLRKVGEGAVGEVYEAEHVLIHRRVAVKVLQRRIANDRDAITRLQREAESTTGLGHPNIVDCFDFGYSDDGHVYLVMEWLVGENLDERLARGPVDIPTALDIAAQAANGLAEAHAHGVIHRDLKPANLFLTKDRGGALCVKVLDFGIAKLALHETKLTGTGVLIGTPNYMAPEQAYGEAVDARTDIYALGVILYEMLTGSVPFVADSPIAVLHQHTSRMPVPPSTRAPERGISHEVETIVMQCLAKTPADRFASMHEVIAALTEVGGVAEPPRPSTSLRRQRPGSTSPNPRSSPAPSRRIEDDRVPRRPRRWWVPVAIVVLALAGVGIAVVLWPGANAQQVAHATLDAAPVSTPGVIPDAAVAGPVDATPAPADATNAAPPAIIEGHAKRFAFKVAVTPAVPSPDQPFELAITLSDLDPALRDAAAAGTLTASLELAYFKDHAQVHASTHRVGADGSFTVVLSVPRVAKHHAHVDLLVGGREVDHAHFDLFPTIAPR